MSNKDTIFNYSFNKEDICIIGIPSYGGRVPSIALERIQKLKGNSTKAILVVSYGNRDYEDTLKELSDCLTNKGFNCIAGIAAIAEHSIMHEFATGHPNEIDQKELVQFTQKIIDKIKNKTFNHKLELPGNYPYRNYSGVPLKPKVSNECTHCGLCAKACPTGAISIQKPNKTNKELCISCMRCIDICPHNARKLNSLLLKIASHKMRKSCQKRKDNELFI